MSTVKDVIAANAKEWQGQRNDLLTNSAKVSRYTRARKYLYSEASQRIPSAKSNTLSSTPPMRPATLPVTTSSASHGRVRCYHVVNIGTPHLCAWGEYLPGHDALAAKVKWAFSVPYPVVGTSCFYHFTHFVSGMRGKIKRLIRTRVYARRGEYLLHPTEAHKPLFPPSHLFPPEHRILHDG